MKRKAQIILIAVSLLLTAILITTCIFSGTFAKYSTAGSDSAAARVAKFGVVAEITSSAKFTETSQSISLPAYDSVSGKLDVMLDSAGMEPGTNLKDAFLMKISGEAETRVLVTIDFDIDFNETLFTLENDDPDADPELYFPVVYYAGKGTTANPIALSQMVDSKAYTTPTTAKAKIDYAFNTAYATLMNMQVVSNSNGGYSVAKIFEAGEKITLADLDVSDSNRYQLGFEWPFVDNAATNAKETQLVLNKDLNATVKLNVKIEQIKGDYSYPTATAPQ